MKKQLLFLAVIFMASQIINAQCLRSGSFVQSDPAYAISGTANIAFTTSGDKDVIFDSNFVTVQGLDLRVYLSKTDDILAIDSEAEEVTRGPLLGDNGLTSPVLSPITGMKTFTIPATVELADFDFIVIQCIGINERWGYASLGTNTGTDCASLSIEENVLTNMTIFPNPSKGNITLQAQTKENAQISVYDILGKEVYRTSQSLNSDINLKNLRSGVYLLRLEADGKQITKRLIIE
jgi:hypothetical protein